MQLQVHLLTINIVPYYPEHMMPAAMSSLLTFEGFNEEDRRSIFHGNALKLFPSIEEKLSKRYGQVKS